MIIQPSSRASRPPDSPPAFAHTTRCTELVAPFRAGVHARCERFGRVILTARLNVRPSCTSLLVHWEVARDARLQTRERYGVVVARPPSDVCITLDGLELGRTYRFRFWAGGHWSRVGRFRTHSHDARGALQEAHVALTEGPDSLHDAADAWPSTICFS